MGVKPGLRDIWAAGISLMTVRAPNYGTPEGRPVTCPSLDHCMTISKHRKAAYYDYTIYQGEEPPVPHSSSRVYRIVISGYFLSLAKEKWNGKLSKHIQENPPTIDTITENVRKLTGPNFLKTFFFSFTSNALTTAARRKHFQTPENACLYCKTGEDSINHLFNSCTVVKAAATGLFSSPHQPLRPPCAKLSSPTPSPPSRKKPRRPPCASPSLFGPSVSRQLQSKKKVTNGWFPIYKHSREPTSPPSRTRKNVMQRMSPDRSPPFHQTPSCATRTALHPPTQAHAGQGSM